MSSTINYKTNNLFLGYSPWGYYSDNGLQNVLGNPANNAVKKTGKDKKLDLETNYQYLQKNYKSVQPNILNTYNFSGWWGQHYFGATATTLNQDQLNYGPSGEQKNKFKETENKYAMSYAYPLIDNYLSGGLSLNYNEKSVGFDNQEKFSKLGIDLGLSINNLPFRNFSLGFGLKNYGRQQEINNLEFKPEASLGLGTSYRFDNNIVIAGDYNKYLSTNLFNTSLRGKYEFTSTYLNLSPEITYMLNNNIAKETQQRLGFNLNLGKEFKIERTVKKSYEVPTLAGFNYSYQISNDATLPLQFKKITITKEFSQENRNWGLSIYAPPLNKILNNTTEVYCVFELKNEEGKKYYFTREADKNSPKESIALNATVPAGKYEITSYYADQHRKILSPIYTDPEPKYVGICYNIKESVVDSNLTIPRQDANTLYDLQDEYLDIYRNYSECFDYIETNTERQKKEEAYGTINVIYVYLEETNKLQNKIETNKKEIVILRDKISSYNNQFLNSALSGNKYHDLRNIRSGAIVKIEDLEKENIKTLERIEENKNEINTMQAKVNKINALPELIGLSADEQIKTMIESRPLYLERHKELNDQRLKGLKLYKMNALNNDFYHLYLKAYDSLTKMVRSDILEQTKQLSLNQTGIDNLVSGVLKKNNITTPEKTDINNLKFGESIIRYYPWHNTQKTKWEEKQGYLQIGYDKVEALKKEDYATFIKKEAQLRGNSRLKQNSKIQYEIKKYETRWKNIYSPYYLEFDLSGGYSHSFGTDQTNEQFIQAGISVRGF